MAFEYYNIEDNIVAKLVADFNISSLNVDVVPQPEDEADLIKGINKPRVTVSFVESNAERLKSTNEHAFEEDITMVINIQWKALRGTSGCHTLASLIKKFIIGFKPADCGRMYFKNYRGGNPVRNPDDKLWYWELEFGVKKMMVQELDDSEPDGELLEEIIINEEIGCN